MKMEMRSTRKKDQFSPVKKARTSLDFEHIENTPPRKRHIISLSDTDTDSSKQLSPTSVVSPTETEEEDYPIAIKSFYGKREKKHFPHSPKRRKAVEQVLAKLSHEPNSTTNEGTQLTMSRSKSKRSTSVSDENRKPLKTRKVSKEEGAHDEIASPLSLQPQNINCTTPLSESKEAAVTRKGHSIRRGAVNIPTNQSTSQKISETTTKREHSIKRGAVKTPSKQSTSQNTSETPTKREHSIKRGAVNTPYKQSTSQNASETPTNRDHSIRGGAVNTPTNQSTSQITSETPTTQGASGKKFFKNKSPGSKLSERVVVRKGFNLSFTTRRSLGSDKKGKGSTKKAGQKISGIVTKTRKNCTRGVQKRTISSRSEPSRDSDSAIGSCNSTELSPTVGRLTNSPVTPRKSQCKKASVSGDSVDSPSKNLRSQTQQRTDVHVEVTSLTGSDDLFSSYPDSENTTLSTKNSPLSDLSSETASDITDKTCSIATSAKKYFPIFNSQGTPKQHGYLQGVNRLRKNSPRNSPRMKFIENKSDQLTLDAGQKRFGATQCEVCGMVYTQADPADETTHNMFHRSLLNALKFPGWKKERVVQEFPEDGSRVLMVLHDDPKYAVKKIEEINKVMGKELGFPEPLLAFRPEYKAFLLISDEKRVMGCCIAEPVTEGYRVIPDSQPSQEPGHRPWCCNSEPEPASVGIGRIWVNSQDRRKRVATRLLDCVRKWFQYGSFIHRSRVAFSDPTPDGKLLATNYSKSPSFLVYKYG